MISARTLLLPIAVVAAVALAAERPAAWGFEAHRLIADRAIDLLPAAIRPFFVKHRAFISEHAIDPDLWRTAGWVEEPPQHFLDMDAFGPAPFDALPREKDAAIAKFGKEMVQKNGLLPWRVEEMHGKLVRAFADVKAERPLREGQHQVPERGARALRRRCARAVPRGGELRRPADQPARPALALRIAAVRALPRRACASGRCRSA